MHGSILVVEDDQGVREAMVAFLEGEGFDVLEAGDGAQALLRLRMSPAVCLILLDLFMPIMNGWTFRTEQLSDPALSTIPVIAVSADGAAARRAAGTGMTDYLVKPIDFDRLLTLVTHHC